ncbi:hypothetical protein QBC36DRAFT_312301 [Triangularia setosa]|uniref:Uncharacterized protein n=1 Tax=Triangularia setosa TaxID=2587417 RepID=A0AAN6W6K7_9PEZI|nr:hypothetical protein QBC36DRAFT_312301 [Podospora setosa]
MLTFSSVQPTRQPARGVHRAQEADEGNTSSQCPNSFTTIKAAMAAGLGRSLFLFQGLSNISPRILTEASLSSPTLPPSPTYQERQDQDNTNMGNSESRPSRESKLSFRASRLSTTPETSPASASKRTKPEYKLKIVCSTCASKGLAETACSTANDINANGGSNLAFQDGSSYYEKYELKTWKLEIDCCGWSRMRKAGTDMVEKYMKNAEEKRRPISVDDLLVKLEESGIGHRSNVVKRVYRPRGQDARHQRDSLQSTQPQQSRPQQLYYSSQQKQQQQQQQQQQQHQYQQSQQAQSQPQTRTRQGWSQQSWHQGAEYQYPGRR